MKIIVIFFCLQFLFACNTKTALNDTVNQIPDLSTNTDNLLSLSKQNSIYRFYIHESFEDEFTRNISLVDIFTNEKVATLELQGYQSVQRIWELGDEKYVIYLVDWTNDDIFQELIIVNSSLEVLEKIEYDPANEPVLNGSIIRLVDDDLLVLGNEAGIWNPNEPDKIFNPVLHNLRTKETNFIASTNQNFDTFHFFVNDTQVLVSNQYVNLSTREINFIYGLLDIEKGEVKYFVQNNFLVQNVEFFDGYALFNFARDTSLKSNYVLIFDIENKKSRMLELLPGDNHNAQFSYEGNYIITTNIDDFTLRRYDFDGYLLEEHNITIAFDFEYIDGGLVNLDDHNSEEINFDFEVFSLTENSYAVVIHAGVAFWSGISQPPPITKVIILN